MVAKQRMNVANNAFHKNINKRGNVEKSLVSLSFKFFYPCYTFFLANIWLWSSFNPSWNEDNDLLS